MHIPKADTLFPASFKNDDDKKLAFEQYRILVETLNHLHTIRESSNFFWIPVNVGAISAISYVREMDKVATFHKQILVWLIIIIGFGMCFSWIVYLRTIQQSIEKRNELLIKLEKFFPIPLFTNLLYNQSHTGKSKLTITQILVPCLFLGGYLFFAILMLFFSTEVV
ncbi:MAG: RipA family octameric membrane protein [Janthinobacterium lividum]